MKVLLVEDNAADAYLARLSFSRLATPVEIVVAWDGAQALSLLRGVAAPPHAPDLILLDLNLPGMNGWELLQRLKSDEALRRIPVVILSSSRAVDDVRAGYEMCAAAYVAKPDNARKMDDIAANIESFWFKAATLTA